MRIISERQVQKAVAELCVKASQQLRPDCLAALRKAKAGAKDLREKKLLEAIIKNARIAKNERLPICQDTGVPCVFVELGQEARVSGDFLRAVRSGVMLGYRRANCRESMVNDPIKRGKSGYLPAVVHTEIVKGSRLKITVMPKGFGCENKTQLKMFKPTAGIEEINKFIIDAVRAAGPDACPPYVVGVGIGGTADYACLMAKKALLCKVTSHPLAGTPFGSKSQVTSSGKKSRMQKLEQELLKEINKLNIGPMGLGGKSTCLGVNIETYPTHIAGLPVAVNISCHALRSAVAIL